MEFGNPEGLKHAKDYNYSPSLLGRVLDKVPFLGGYRDYKRARDYKRNVHDEIYQEEDFNRNTPKEYNRPMNASGSMPHYFSERAQNEMNDSTIRDIFRGRSFVQALDDPRDYSYRNFIEENDKEIIDQFIRGSKAGHVLEENDIEKHAIDPYNIAKFERGRSFFGIPVGYSGSVKKNPGIDPYVKPEYFKDQITEGGRMQVY